VVRHQDSQQQSQLDHLLWAFSDSDFLPHVVLDSSGTHVLARHTPVLLCVLDQAIQRYPQQDHSQILINLGTTTPSTFTDYDRLIEIVPREAQATEAGRVRYRFYQQHGYPLNHITAK
jgi:DNA polymerase-3 subunit chi